MTDAPDGLERWTRRAARIAVIATAFVVVFVAGAALATRADAQRQVATDSIEDPGAPTVEPEPPAPTQPPPSTVTQPNEQTPPVWRSRRASSRPEPEPPPAWTVRKAEPAAVPTGARPDRTPRQRPRRGPKAPDPTEWRHATAGTIWLHRTLPDPISPAARLDPAFADELAAAARNHRVGWSLVLAALRARGASGSVPAGPLELQILAGRLSALGSRSAPERALRLLSDSESFAEKALALARYNRAVGLYSLVTGLEQARPRLQRMILRDPRIDVYWGGEGDIRSGRIDVRVLVLIRYLANVHGQVTVSSLHSGHGLYSRPGVISAHIYGLAVDISALEGVSILGHQQPAGVTERAVRNILLLPEELQPKQVISLLGLGGPSFPLGNHDDHIHVGY
jgi:hypothetical protein